jgi:predicted phage baseplate assembly protein
VNVLLLVDKENDHSAFAPMTIEALSAQRHFKPIVADDTTRALGESGILSMSFAVSPTLSELFGATQTWLRLNPKSANGGWTPSVRGAYLNAVYASAKETLTREPVGSADGSPNLTLRLARPPVLRNTLELRVREPLGEEEREELINRDTNLVVSDPEGLPGDWVLWEEVLDPDDAGPSDRVYSLDDETGEIRFGDGIHGRIPPIGRDAIVAFGYSRTEGSRPGSETVPANSIKPRTPLNLVSPVESVESVIAADQAAGGAPPETDERVLRFGFARLRHRDRAVTAKDIEDLAMQSSPDIAQAKVVVMQGYVRLVVVMKGKDPTPNAAQKRELSRTLLDVSSISLSATSAFRINGPGIRKLRVELLLDIPRLDYAGQVSKWVKGNLTRFFDTSIGGVDGTGWLLGAVPTADDIAFILGGAPNVDSVAEIRLYENVGNGVEKPVPESVKPTDIVVLDDDPVRIQFQTAEVTV